MLSDAVVGEVLLSVGTVINVLARCSKAYLGLPEKPDGEWIPVGYHDPLADVEFPLEYDEGILDLLHAHKLTFLLSDLFHDLYDRVEHADSSPAGQPRRLHDPYVGKAV